MAAKTIHSTSNDSRKRKNRSKKGGDGRKWEQEQEDYYQRLLYSATKLLRKQAKLVRNLESQKLVRKIKERREKQSVEKSSRTNDDKNGIDGTYQQLKHLDLEYVVQESLRRLGILHLDPKMARVAVEEGNDDDDDDDAGQEEVNHLKPLNEESSPRNSQHATKNSPTKKEKELVEKILRHKKMQSTLEEWNDKVTEYRRWTLHQQERMEPGFFQNHSSDPAASSSKKKKNKKRKASGNSTANNTSNKNIPEDNNKSLFVCLGDDNDRGASQEEDDYDGMMPHYGPGSIPEEKKKNRMGQRQRKAKQMAIEAKKAGRLHRAADSVNWRKIKKPNNTTTTTPEDENQMQRQYPAAKHMGGSSSGKAPAKSEEQLHPSWAAAQKKKESSGIVQFQGKKITF